MRKTCLFLLGKTNIEIWHAVAYTMSNSKKASIIAFGYLTILVSINNCHFCLFYRVNKRQWKLNGHSFIFLIGTHDSSIYNPLRAAWTVHILDYLKKVNKRKWDIANNKRQIHRTVQHILSFFFNANFLVYRENYSNLLRNFIHSPTKKKNLHPLGYLVTCTIISLTIHKSPRSL